MEKSKKPSNYVSIYYYCVIVRTVLEYIRVRTLYLAEWAALI